MSGNVRSDQYLAGVVGGRGDAMRTFSKAAGILFLQPASMCHERAAVPNHSTKKKFRFILVKIVVP